MSFKYPVIDMRATGAHIKELMNTREVTVQDVQEAMGLASPQAVYRWLRGSNMPSVDNLYALSRYLNVSMEDVIVEKAAFVYYNNTKCKNNLQHRLRQRLH